MSNPETTPQPTNREIYTPNWQPFSLTLHGDFKFGHIVLSKGLPAAYEVDIAYLQWLKNQLIIPGDIVLYRKTSEPVDPALCLPKSGKFSDSIGSGPSGGAAMTLTEAPENPKKRRGLRRHPPSDQPIPRHVMELDFEEIYNQGRENKQVTRSELVQKEILRQMMLLALAEAKRPGVYESLHAYVFLSYVNSSIHTLLTALTAPTPLAELAKDPVVGQVWSWLMYTLVWVVFIPPRSRRKDELPNQALEEMNKLTGSDPTHHIDKNRSRARNFYDKFVPVVLRENTPRLVSAPLIQTRPFTFVRPSHQGRLTR